MTRNEACEAIRAAWDRNANDYDRGAYIVDALEAVGLLEFPPEVDQSPINKIRDELRRQGFNFAADAIDVILKYHGCKIVEDK
jgi:hypothetical protein